MKNYRLIYLSLEEYLYSSWRTKPWTGRIYYFRRFLCGMSMFVRLIVYQLIVHFCPSWLVHDPFHMILTYMDIKPPIYYSMMSAIMFCVIVQFVLSFTFDQPLTLFVFLDKHIYKLEKSYLDNLEVRPVENIGKTKRLISSYFDKEIMLLTSGQYHQAHSKEADYFDTDSNIYHRLLVRINHLELVFAFITAITDLSISLAMVFLFFATNMADSPWLALVTLLQIALIAFCAYDVCVFMCSMTYIISFVYIQHLNYLYSHLDRFSRRRGKLIRVINYTKTQMILAMNKFNALNKENGQFMLTLLIVMNMPINIFLVNYLFLVKTKLLMKIHTMSMILVQLLGIFGISIMSAFTSNAFHSRARMLVGVQGNVKNVRAKLSVLKLFELMHTKNIVSLSLGPIEKINFTRVFKLILLYIANFLLVQNFIRDFRLT